MPKNRPPCGFHHFMVLGPVVRTGPYSEGWWASHSSCSRSALRHRTTVDLQCHYLYNTTPSKSSLKTTLKSHVLNFILSVTLNVVLNVLLIAKINGTRSLSFELELTWTRPGGPDLDLTWDPDLSLTIQYLVLHAYISVHLSLILAH